MVAGLTTGLNVSDPKLSSLKLVGKTKGMDGVEASQYFGLKMTALALVTIGWVLVGIQGTEGLICGGDGNTGWGEADK